MVLPVGWLRRRGERLGCGDLQAVERLGAGPLERHRQPVVFRLGYGGAAEEPMWLLVAKPDLARNYGKAYTLDATRFTGSRLDRFGRRVTRS